MSIIINDKDKYKRLLKMSNPEVVLQNAIKYFNDPKIELYISGSGCFKYMIYSPSMKKINFGDINYEDYTKHNNEERRDNYLKRSESIRGNWKEDKYSKNNLSRILLWDAKY